MDKKEIKAELEAYFSTLEVVNTHCHHVKDSYFKDVTLYKLVRKTYNNWICPPFENDAEGFAFFFDKMQVNSYCYWLVRAYGELYNGGEKLSLENHGEIDAVVRKAYNDDPDWHKKILTEHCKYKYLVLDDYKAPGSTHELTFARPTFRVDMFLSGNYAGQTDHNENNPYDYFEKAPSDVDEYIEQVEKAVAKKIKMNKSRSLKTAIAYERPLDFTEFSRENAQKVFGKDNSDKARKIFGDYVMDCLCKIAAKHDIPFQIHTGLGNLDGTRAINLRNIIDRNPDTKFVLFHGSYPWTGDVLGLAHKYKNVYPDMCWLPIISTAAAERFLEEALDVSDSDRLCWGCDTWTSEESYGALLAMRYVLSKVLSGRVFEGFYTLEYAKTVGKKILFDNANNLYKF